MKHTYLSCILAIMFANSGFGIINHNPNVTSSPDYTMTFEFIVSEVSSSGGSANQVQNQSGDLEVIPVVGSGANGGNSAGKKNIKITLAITEPNGSNSNSTNFFKVKAIGDDISGSFTVGQTESKEISVSASTLESSSNSTVVLELYKQSH